MSLKLVVVTATTNLARATDCLVSWGHVEKIIVYNGTLAGDAQLSHAPSTLLTHRAYLGTVPAFQVGVDYALDHTDADLIACFHDDLELLDPRWSDYVVRSFEQQPACGLAGFGGAIGLGTDDLYQTPYDPMQLARIGFRSNLVDAEVHGLRSLLRERVACLDGFSQIGRRAFWEGQSYAPIHGLPAAVGTDIPLTSRVGEYLGIPRAAGPRERPFTYLHDHGLIHHFYDGALGALAARAGWECWYLPVRCRHLGGQTAVGDQGYHAWAKDQILGGDQGFWQQSHQRGYELFSDVLPLRV